MHSKIQNPHNWLSIEEWMQFANQFVATVSVDPSWTDDQKWLSQWFRHETLFLKSTSDFTKRWSHVCKKIFALREAFLENPTSRIQSELRQYENIYAKMYSGQSQWVKEHYEISMKSAPKVMVQDQYGYIHGLFMCLSTGMIAIDSAENVGHSFAELGIQPQAVYNREFGVYYRVL
jgi:hypothetical protein